MYIKIGISLMLINLVGCGGVFQEYNSSTGSVTTHRFHSQEEKAHYFIDLRLSEEMQGRHPSAGKKTWREYWEWTVSLWRQHNNLEDERYFYRRRKELGLKDVDRL
jgi:hypothetical protein